MVELRTLESLPGEGLCRNRHSYVADYQKLSRLLNISRIWVIPFKQEAGELHQTKVDMKSIHGTLIMPP